MEDVTIDIGRPLNAQNLKSMGIIDQVRAKQTLDTSWEALRDQRKIPNGLYLFSKIDPQEVVAYYLQNLANQGVDISEFSMDWLPERPPHFMKRMRDPSKKSNKAKKEKLGESSGSRPLVSLAGSPKILNETTSPSSSSSPQSPPYYVLSYDNEPSDPQSPTLSQLQARALASQQPSHTKPKPNITSPPPEHPNPTTSEQPQTPPPAQQPNPPPEQPINSEPQPTHSPSEPNPQPEQTTLSPLPFPHHQLLLPPSLPL
ncbi:uncharacterized protein LOC127094245 [Lathyrus oleraceus]|uniref:uncharacterized protein LOC127094245 n=1 Tax=Pisum sativum TaxID=3888 RepID=UPI0021D1FBDC|nr:uncharacterized protein LOC127094245 [Pisum sativum]